MRVGTVLLTGIVDDQETRIEAVKLVWKVNGVEEVIINSEVVTNKRKPLLIYGDKKKKFDSSA